MIDNKLNLISELCLADNRSIVTAESCTGGLLAKLITDKAGSSQWFERGFVTYSNEAKEEMLGVDKQLIAEHGAVSEAVVNAMAIGALQHSNGFYSIAVSGIAGPGGGSENKPVGTVCFAWACYKASGNEAICCQSTRQLFSGDRESIREQAAEFSFIELYQRIVSKNCLEMS